MAPGRYIESANSYYNVKDLFWDGSYEKDGKRIVDEEYLKKFNKNTDEFYLMSGTSQATPMVSGVATLVSQKFPFMGGK